MTADLLVVLTWIAATPLAKFIRESDWAFPAIESVHVIGLTLAVGTIAIIDFHLLGWASAKRRYAALSRAVLPWTWGAFTLAAAAGVLLFISKPLAYWGNMDFRIKLLLLLLAGGNMAVFQLFTVRRMPQRDDAETAPLAARIAGAVSLLCWIAIVVFGRRIGFSLT